MDDMDNMDNKVKSILCLFRPFRPSSTVFFCFMIGVLLLSTASLVADDTLEFPVLYQGRVHPADAYARLWMQDHGGQVSAKSLGALWREELSATTPPSSPLFLALPAKQKNGQWLPLNTLRQKQIVNDTLYSDEAFRSIQEAYLSLRHAYQTGNGQGVQAEMKKLSTLLAQHYRALAGKNYYHADHKALAYPTVAALYIERLTVAYPWPLMIALLYGAALLAFMLPLHITPRLVFVTAFTLHTTLLVARSIILMRPPVSNMFETLLFVPWVSAGIALLCNRLFAYVAASLLAFVLLILPALIQMRDSLEPLQAVLDSPFWLTVHVLSVVGSYGFFFLASLFAHMILLSTLLSKEAKTAALVLVQLLYAGTFLLVTGTLLGGMWAAESWGRFWDWDPKESWAFISCCLYLTILHAYRNLSLSPFGLSIGATLGFLVISFTWYGVNYLVGSGMHSYGFGSGGELVYFFLLVADLLFLASAVKKVAKKGGYRSTFLLSKKD